MLTEQEEQLIAVEVDRIVVNPFQPRRTFSDDDLEELASSIRHVGLLHPPLVRPSPLLPGFFELVSGERRFRAWQKLGKKTMTVFVRQTEESMAAQAALIENIQRTDLNPMEIAIALEKLARKNHWTQEELAQRIGKKRSTVANYLRLLSLPASGQKALREGAISMGHAKVLLSLDSTSLQEQLLNAILRKGWSVRQAEQWVPTKKRKKAERDIHTIDLEERLQKHLGTKVHITGSSRKGQMVIDYYGLDDLERLLTFFGMDANKESGAYEPL